MGLYCTDSAQRLVTTGSYSGDVDLELTDLPHVRKSATPPIVARLAGVIQVGMLRFSFLATFQSTALRGTARTAWLLICNFHEEAISCAEGCIDLGPASIKWMRYTSL